MKVEHTLESVNFLAWRFAGNALAAWVVAAIVFIVVFIVLRTAKRVFERRAARFAVTTATKLDDLFVKVVRGTNSFFLLIVALWAASLALKLNPWAVKAVHVTLIIVFLWQAGIWGNRILDFTIERLVSLHAEDGNEGVATMTGALSFVGRVALWSLIIVLMLSNLNVNVTTLIAGVGVGGVAIALAVQNILGDLFASFSIIFDRPFAVGHFIVVDNLAGTVEHVGIKSTRIRSLSGEELVVSNGDLLKARIHNYKRFSERRILFSFGVVYSTPYEKLEAIPAMVREIIEAREHLRFDRTHFKEYGDSSLNFEVVYYVQSPDYTLYMDAQQAINLALFKKFEAEGIAFAFPTRELYVHQVAATPSEPPSVSPPAPDKASSSVTAQSKQ